MRARSGERARQGGITIVELLLVVLILATVAGITVPVVIGHMERANRTEAITDIRALEIQLEMFAVRNDRHPDTLAEIGEEGRRDPWGNPYRYLNIQTASGLGEVRKDRNLVPLNSTFDLYSMGPDGASQPALTAAASKDDIIRANDGGYVGPAADY